MPRIKCNDIYDWKLVNVKQKHMEFTYYKPRPKDFKQYNRTLSIMVKADFGRYSVHLTKHQLDALIEILQETKRKSICHPKTNQQMSKIKCDNWLGCKRIEVNQKHVSFEYFEPSPKDLKRYGRHLKITAKNDFGNVFIKLNGRRIKTLIRILEEAGEIPK